MMTARLNSFLEKKPYLIVTTSLILGFAFPDFFIFLKPLVPWVFALYTLTQALKTSLRDLERVFSSPLPLLLILLCVHGISPLFAFFLGKFAFGPDSPFFTGLVLTSAIPIAVSSTLWVGLAGGHLPLALSAVAIDSLLCPLTVPFLISLFLKKSVDFDASSLILSLLQMVLIPTLIGVLIHELTKGRNKTTRAHWRGLYAKFSLSFIIAVNIASAQTQSLSINLPGLFLVILTFLLFNMTLGYWVARLMGYSPVLTRTFIFVIGLRNNGVGIVIALSYFPPEVALPLIATILLQQPVSSIILPLLNKKTESSTTQQ
ncbi:MAG TPA: bile acid:sodium symporter family protein [Bacillota bacterium]